MSARQAEEKITALYERLSRDDESVGDSCSFQTDFSFVVDEKVTAVVKRIFDLCIAGKGPMQIAKILKKDNVLIRKKFRFWDHVKIAFYAHRYLLKTRTVDSFV